MNHVMVPPLFFFRTNRRHPDKAGFILCRITIDKADEEFTTPVRVLRKDWDSSSKRVRGLSKAARLSNALLTDIESDINRIYYDQERMKKYITAERVLRLYKAGTGPQATLLLAWTEFVEKRKPLQGISLSAAKLQQEAQRGRLMQAFLETKKRQDLLPIEFTGGWADDFLTWLRTERKSSQNYAAKVVQTVKQVLRWCVRHKYADNDPLQGYGLKFAPPKPPLFLSADELARLEKHAFAAGPLRAVADCFLFQCYTGLAYADLERFRRTEHTRIGPDLKPWLYMGRQKTQHSTAQVATIRLLPPALRLLDKYGDKLPVITNQVYNRYLKEVAVILEFDNKRLTSHIGRKTAGALLLKDGMSLDAVSKILGHSSVLMTQRHYCQITDNVVSREFTRIYGNQ